MALISSISAHLFAYEPLELDHLKAISKAGYGHVELWAMSPHLDYEEPALISRLKGWLDDLSLSVPSFHAPFYAHFDEARAGNWLSISSPRAEVRENSLRHIERSMRVMADFGARIAVLHPGAPAPWGDSDTLDALRESVERLIPLAETLGLTLAVENVPAPLGCVEPLANFVQQLGHPRLGVCLDAGHANMTDGNWLEEAFAKLAPLAVTTHLHDNDGNRDAHLVPGDGQIPWSSLWSALQESGYEGPLTYELRRSGENSYSDVLERVERISPLAFAGDPAKSRVAEREVR